MIGQITVLGLKPLIKRVVGKNVRARLNDADARDLPLEKTMATATTAHLRPLRVAITLHHV